MDQRCAETLDAMATLATICVRLTALRLAHTILTDLARTTVTIVATALQTGAVVTFCPGRTVGIRGALRANAVSTMFAILAV